MFADATQLLVDIRIGRRTPGDLFPLVLEELRRIATGLMQGERRDHSLQATALVHEAYMRLIRQDGLDPQDRTHFFAIAACAMRQILVDHARQRNRQKRRPKGEGVPLDFALADLEEKSGGFDLEAVDTALTRLAEIEPTAAELVQLRFFGGLTMEEAAEAQGVSISTAERQWRYARAWLRERLAPGTAAG